MGKATVKDGNGVEYSLQWNVGQLGKVTWPDRGKRNGSAEIEVPGFQHKIVGYFDSRDTELANTLKLLDQKNQADGPVFIAFRLEVHRDQTVDGTIPWDDVPADKDHRHKRLVGVYEDGTPAGNELLLQAEREANPQKTAPVANQPSEPEPMRSGGAQVDTWGFSATLAAVTQAFETLSNAKAGGVVQQFKPGDIKEIADRLARIADNIQASVTEKVNRNANSHTRARGVLRMVLDFNPIPVATEDREAWEDWENRVTRTGQRIMAVAKDLHEAHLAAS